MIKFSCLHISTTNFGHARNGHHFQNNITKDKKMEWVCLVKCKAHLLALWVIFSMDLEQMNLLIVLYNIPWILALFYLEFIWSQWAFLSKCFFLNEGVDQIEKIETRRKEFKWIIIKFMLHVDAKCIVNIHVPITKTSCL